MDYFTFTLESSLSLLTLEQLHWFVPTNALYSLRLFPPEAFLIHDISRSPPVFRQLHCKSLIQVKHNILLNLDLEGNRHKCKVDAKCCLAWMFCAEPCTKHWAGRPGPCSWVNADRDSFELADYSGKKSSSTDQTPFGSRLPEPAAPQGRHSHPRTGLAPAETPSPVVTLSF